MAQSADPLLELLPADCLMCLRINQFEQTLNGLGQYLAGVVPMDVSGITKMQLIGMLGNMNMAGIDMTGHFGAYVPAPSQQQMGLQAMERAPLILIPVTDYQQFVTSSTNVSEPDDQVQHNALVVGERSSDRHPLPILERDPREPGPELTPAEQVVEVPVFPLCHSAAVEPDATGQPGRDLDVPEVDRIPAAARAVELQGGPTADDLRAVAGDGGPVLFRPGHLGDE